MNSSFSHTASPLEHETDLPAHQTVAELGLGGGVVLVACMAVLALGVQSKRFDYLAYLFLGGVAPLLAALLLFKARNYERLAVNLLIAARLFLAFMLLGALMLGGIEYARKAALSTSRPFFAVIFGSAIAAAILWLPRVSDSIRTTPLLGVLDALLIGLLVAFTVFFGGFYPGGIPPDYYASSGFPVGQSTVPLASDLVIYAWTTPHFAAWAGFGLAFTCAAIGLSRFEYRTVFMHKRLLDRLAQRSLLSGPPRGVTLAEARDRKIFRRQGAYTYVSDTAGHRFESRRSHSHKTTIQTGPSGEIEKIILTGIRLQSESGALGSVEEDWTLEKTSEGALSWAITQRWIDPVSIDISGTPALHLARFGGWGAYRDRRVDPADPQITSTVWYDPAHLNSGTHPDYETYAMPSATEYRTHTIDVRDTWAVYKLFTNFHLKSDLRLAVKGGYLFRRAGVRNDFNEIGATVKPELHFERQPGDVSTITLFISSADKFASGQQLAVEIPDQVLANELRDLHASMLNGGVISDPKRYDFGNGTEDVNYAGSADFQARALSVSTALGTLAEHPYNADDAFKRHLARILATVDDRGLTRFGFNASGALIDDNLHVISAAKTYAVKTGDRKFIRRYYATFGRMIDFFTTRLDKSNGLFRSPEKGAHWYYDGIGFSGFSAYYQAFLYQALIDLSEMAEIIGNAKDAALRRDQAKRLADAINAFMWFPDAPGGPRYADWIDESGNRAAYFIDLAQYPLIAFGIAPPDRAEAMLATADRRLTELKERFGHSRSATLSLLWPLSPTRGERCFGTYFYGGSLLASTYWEVLARAHAGHVDGEWGAYRLLQNFAKRFAETSFVGSNSIDIRGNVSLGGDEGFLADMVVVPAALVHGLLGVKMSWQEIKVTPAMPSAWEHAKTSLVWKGRLYDLTIRGNSVDISPR